MWLTLSDSFATNTSSLLSKSFVDHQASYRDLAARALVDHTIQQFKLDIPTIPIPTASLHGARDLDKPSEADPICIVGAGAAGLYAAMILDDLGVEYEILEASERVGGRVFTYRFNGEEGYNAPVGTPDRLGVRPGQSYPDARARTPT